ncbi:DNA alkylation repair protein [Candidatus Saccharibacteria bacterium]|nr:DNA alkylation repair protein [Candidatus Saccharibacteria bacterium]
MVGIKRKNLNFRDQLASLVDDEYRDFSMRGIPCDRPFLGVRIPEIRKVVEKVPLEDFTELLESTPVAIEEVIARGFLIARLPYAEMLKYFDSQIGYLDNWCSVDTFCASLRKNIKGHKVEFLDAKIEPLLVSREEFAVRAGLVFLLDFYVDFDYLFLIFDRIESLRERDEYYVRMAVAWLLAECFIKYPDETFSYLGRCGLEKWTFNKAISKICDSHRVSEEVKKQVKLLRKK